MVLDFSDQSSVDSYSRERLPMRSLDLVLVDVIPWAAGTTLLHIFVIPAVQCVIVTYHVLHADRRQGFLRAHSFSLPLSLRSFEILEEPFRIPHTHASRPPVDLCVSGRLCSMVSFPHLPLASTTTTRARLLFLRGLSNINYRIIGNILSSPQSSPSPSPISREPECLSLRETAELRGQDTREAGIADESAYSVFRTPPDSPYYLPAYFADDLPARRPLCPRGCRWPHQTQSVPSTLFLFFPPNCGS